jgi:predicted RNase H-like HicB family nuclease
LEVARQGKTVESARANLAEAVSLFLEHASKSEIRRRLNSEVYVPHFEVAVA